MLNKIYYWPGLILFCASLLLGLFVYKDYGKSWDEPVQRQIGQVTYDYVFNGDNTLKTTYDAREYGSGFELPLIIIEKALNLKDSRDIFLARHLATHIFFLISAFCGYLLALRLFKNQYLACLAFVLLAFNPRIYAHSFFNTKDLPFLSAFLIALLLIQVAFRKNSLLWYFVSGMACGYATSIREMGLLLLPCVLSFFLADLFVKPSVRGRPRTLLNGLFFISGMCGMLYLAWPLLWSNPVFFLTDSLHRLSNAYWTGEVLFLGHTYKGNMLPWNYMPVWFSITIPEFWLLAGLTGFLWLTLSFVKKPIRYLSNTPERNFLLYAACFAGPIIAMTVLHGVNIDDWRHLYYIYPPFVMLILFAVSKLATGKKKVAIALCCALQIVFTGFFMIRRHPFQEVYFNNFISHDREYLRHNFDLEYWGCSYKQGLDFILAHDSAASIRLYNSLPPVANAVSLLPQQSRKRITLVDSAGRPDYFITNFRMHPGDYNYPAILFQVRMFNSTILRVYKLH